MICDMFLSHRAKHHSLTFPQHTRHLGQNILRCGSLILVIQQHRGCFTECRAVYLTSAGTLSSRVEILLPRAAVMSLEPSSEHLYFLCVSLLSFAYVEVCDMRAELIRAIV